MVEYWWPADFQSHVPTNLGRQRLALLQYAWFLICLALVGICSSTQRGLNAAVNPGSFSDGQFWVEEFGSWHILGFTLMTRSWSPDRYLVNGLFQSQPLGFCRMVPGPPTSSMRVCLLIGVSNHLWKMIVFLGKPMCPHLTLHALHSILHTTHFALYTPRFTLLSILQTLHFTLVIQHFTLKG